MARPRTLINGYGRIGRLAHRRAVGWHGAPLSNFDVVWVNELGALESAAYLFQFDSTHGTFSETAVREDGSGFSVTVPAPGGGVGETLTSEVGYSRAPTPAEVSQRKQLMGRGNGQGRTVDRNGGVGRAGMGRAGCAGRPRRGCTHARLGVRDKARRLASHPPTRADHPSLSLARSHTQTRAPHTLAPHTPTQIPFAEAGPIDLVLECTGAFLTRASLQPFFDAGVRAVLVAAPVKDAADPVLNIVYGVNHTAYDPAVDRLLTAASCTTNCLAPVVQVLQSRFGIVRGAITTIHDVTNTQTMVDATNTKKSDLRRARSGMCNLAPTSTGSATAIALIFPELKGKLNGLAVRVPLLNASLTDGVFELGRDVTVAEVNAALEEAAAGELDGILGFETRPLVSSDYVADTRSSIVDAACTQVIDGRLVKVFMWYQNELGYACRMVDTAAMVAARALGAE